jgi:transposase-like protein
MNKRALKGNAKEAFSSLEKRRIVEEIRSGMLTIKQSTQHYQLSVSNLQAWNRWYYRTRLLRYYRPRPSFLMKPSQTTVEQLKQQLAKTQAQLAQVKLQNTALETMISVAEKQLNIEIRKKYGSKRSRS